MLLHNGRIFTARDEEEVVSALALGEGVILGAGTVAELQGLVDQQTERIDLQGCFVCPGFHDAHLHLESGGQSLASLDLVPQRSLAQVLTAVQQEVARLPAGSWIHGRGWDQNLWPEPRWPTRQDLDRIAPAHPVCLMRVDGHVVWVNSLALQQAGISAATPDPRDGEIVREPDSNAPAGILKEGAATLVRGEVSLQQSRQYLELALAQAVRYGLTSVQDVDSSLEALAALRQEDKLPLRIYKWGVLGQDLEQADTLRQRFPTSDDFLVFGALKGFVDGTLGSSTAALFEPYTDLPHQRGILNHTQAELEDLVRAATQRGFQVALHAIGDRAARQALQAFERSREQDQDLPRLRLEHGQLLASPDLESIARNSIIASIQPCHLITDQRWIDQRLGSERARREGYLWRSLHDRTTVALGTDWPVEPLDPLRNIFAAVTRAHPDYPRGPGWNAVERLSMGQALRAYTWGPAYAAFVENRRGRLAAGQDADLVILDRDLMHIAPEELLQTRVLATMLAGRLTFGSLPLC